MARVRTFIGVEIGDAVRANAESLQQALARTGADVNWVPPENLHITLLFLGDVDDRDLAQLCRAVAKAVKGEPPFPLRVSGVGAFPNPRRPKTLWAGITDGTAEMVRLHGLIEKPLLDLGAYRREERAYTPHLTLGRVKSEEAGRQIAPELPKRLAWDGGHTTVEEVVIFSSSFAGGGKGPPTYSAIGRAPLLGARG
jgi:RNA 2',3'-cyclic 3'-phosphodiesterase